MEKICKKNGLDRKRKYFNNLSYNAWNRLNHILFQERYLVKYGDNVEFSTEILSDAEHMVGYLNCDLLYGCDYKYYIEEVYIEKDVNIVGEI